MIKSLGERDSKEGIALYMKKIKMKSFCFENALGYSPSPGLGIDSFPVGNLF